MTQIFLRFLLVVAVAAIPASSLARTQENALWSSQSTGDLSTLRYGSFDADLPLLQLSCFNDMKIAVLDIYDDVGTVDVGDPLAIELAAGTLAAPLKGEAAKADESEEVYAEVSEFPVKPVLNVLAMEGPLSVKIGDTTREFSDLGREQALKEFAQNCKLD